MPFLDNGIFYVDEGAGKPLLFIHGWCMSSAVWQLQRRSVIKENRMLALDLRGHGCSALQGGEIGGFDGYAADIVELFDKLELTGVTAVGWSMGAQALLRAYPRLKERIASLLLVGATPRFTAAAHFPYGLHPDQARGMGLKVRRNLQRALKDFRQRLFAEGELDEPGVAQMVGTVLSTVFAPSPAAAFSGLEALMEDETLAEARQVDCPTLIIHGSLDRICQPEASRWLESAIAGSVRHCYDGCGHAPFLTRPDLFNADLLQLAGGAYGRD